MPAKVSNGTKIMSIEGQCEYYTVWWKSSEIK